MRSAKDPSIKKIDPTIYFVKDADGLKQAVDIHVNNPGDATRYHLQVAVGRTKHSFDLGSAPKGPSSHRVFVPDIREKVKVEFRLLSGKQTLAEKTVNWKPQRHWTVHLVQLAHFDPGYTDLPSNVMNEYLGFLDDIVDWCERTERWPRESRFHYTIEQSWVALHYVENRSPEQVERFARCCRRGQIEVNAFFANMTSELMGPEQMARLMYPAFRLQRRYGIPIRTAEHNDIPGISWGYASILADAGIKIFIPGIPDYFHEREKNPRNFADHIIQPNDLPEAIYWEAQNGKKVLVYLHRQGAGGDPDSNLIDLPGVLERLDDDGYKYNTFRYVLLGGGRDNTPPMFDFAYTVRDWNKKWAYPKYILSNNFNFYTELAKELPSNIPTHRGDYPGTDYTVGSLSTAEAVGVNRAAKRFLLMGERMAAITAEVADYEYPRDMLENAYRETFKHDEHAWGLSMPIGWAADAHTREKEMYAYRAAALADDVYVKSINRLADHLDIPDNNHHIVIFNALDHARSDIVEVPFFDMRTCGLPMVLIEPKPGDPHAPRWNHGTVIGRYMDALPNKIIDTEFDLIDLETGRSVPHQVTHISESDYPARFAAERHSIAVGWTEVLHNLHFIASGVPTVGYKTYKIVPGHNTAPKSTDLRLSANSLENAFYKITVDRRTGCIVSIYDKELERELVDTDAPYHMNEPFTRTARQSVVEKRGKATVRPGKSGPIVASLVIEGAMPGAPQCAQEIVLYSGLKRIDFNNRILKDADGKRRFYTAFPFAIKRPRFTFEGSMNVVRPVDDQLPGTTTDYYAAQQWVKISEGNGSFGITWSARESPMVQLSENWPDYVSQAHHCGTPVDFLHKFVNDPAGFKKGHIYSYVATNNFGTNFIVSQPGVIYSTYSITSHSKAQLTDSRRFGWQACNPMAYAVVSKGRSGKLPTQNSFCSIDKTNVVLTTIKRAEDSDDLIVRLLETEGLDSKVTVTLPFVCFDKAIESNIVEEDQRKIPSDGHSFQVRVGPWSTATVRLVCRRK